MTTDSFPNLACAACGAGFHCAMADTGRNVPAALCWCFALPHDWAVPGDADSSSAPCTHCLCPTCLQHPLAPTAAPAA